MLPQRKEEGNRIQATRSLNTPPSVLGFAADERPETNDEPADLPFQCSAKPAMRCLALDKCQAPGVSMLCRASWALLPRRQIRADPVVGNSVSMLCRAFWALLQPARRRRGRHDPSRGFNALSSVLGFATTILYHSFSKMDFLCFNALSSFLGFTTRNSAGHHQAHAPGHQVSMLCRAFWAFLP